MVAETFFLPVFNSHVEPYWNEVFTSEKSCVGWFARIEDFTNAEIALVFYDNLVTGLEFHKLIISVAGCESSSINISCDIVSFF